MTVDVYAGPLLRFYTFNWQTSLQAWAAAEGIEHRYVGRPDPPDPIRLQPHLQAWREALAEARPVLANGGLDWVESLEAPYATERLGWDGWFGLRYLALMADSPKLRPRWRLQPNLPIDFDEAPRHRMGQLYNIGEPSRLARALGRGSAPPTGRFPNCLLCQFWLPTEFAPPQSAVLPSGKRAIIGSVPVLRREISNLRSQYTVELARAEPDPRQDDAGGTEFWSAAAHGMQLLDSCATFAESNRVPMLLEY